MSLENQETLLDTDIGGTVSIDTNGRIIRPLLSLPSALVDECKIRADETGLRIAAVDPANVAIVELQAHPGAFDAYDVDADGEVLTGVNLSRLESMVADARMRVNDPDPVSLSIGEGLIRTEIERDYASTTVERADETLTIDPDSIRSEPDLPELELPYHVGLDAAAFTDVVNYYESGPYKEVRVEAYQKQEGGGLGIRLTAEDDETTDSGPVESMRIDIEPSAMARDEDSGPAVLSIFSIDFLSDIAKAIKKAKAETVRLHLGDSFPVKIDFWREDDDGETLYEGTFMQAPRIKSDE